MNKNRVIKNLCLSALLWSVPAIATPTNKDSPAGATDPFDMLYSQCTYLSKADGTSPKEKCKSERDALTKRAEPVVAKFYGNFKLRAMHFFNSNLDSIERGAAEYDPARTSFGAQYFAYSTCLAQAALTDNEYLAGKWLIGQRAVKSCQELYAKLMDELPRSKENRKARENLYLLKDDFSRLRAVPLVGSDFVFRESLRF